MKKTTNATAIALKIFSHAYKIEEYLRILQSSDFKSPNFSLWDKARYLNEVIFAWDVLKNCEASEVSPVKDSIKATARSMCIALLNSEEIKMDTPDTEDLDLILDRLAYISFDNEILNDKLNEAYEKLSDAIDILKKLGL